MFMGEATARMQIKDGDIEEMPQATIHIQVRMYGTVVQRVRTYRVLLHYPYLFLQKTMPLITRLALVDKTIYKGKRIYRSFTSSPSKERGERLGQALESGSRVSVRT